MKKVTDTPKTPGERIISLRKERKLSQRSLGQAIGVSDVSVGYWEKDLNKPGGEALIKLAKYLGVNESYILYGIADKKSDASEGALLPRIPVVTIDDLTLWDFKHGSYLIENISNFVYSDSAKSLGSFALRISDRVMEPEFISGDLIIVDPGINEVPGDYVVAKNGLGEIIFKKYRVKGRDSANEPIFELVPINQDYPTDSSEFDKITIIGVMVEHRRFRKK